MEVIWPDESESLPIKTIGPRDQEGIFQNDPKGTSGSIRSFDSNGIPTFVLVSSEGIIMLPYALWSGPFTLVNAWFKSVFGRSGLQMDLWKKLIYNHLQNAICRPLEKCEGLQNDVLQYLDFQLIAVIPSAGLA
jgi:hypothetical protein